MQEAGQEMGLLLVAGKGVKGGEKRDCLRDALC